ncbi:MAG: ribonuclease HII [bacterium]
MLASASNLSWRHEEAVQSNGWKRIAGVDEAGRGCWAGPVVAGALIFLDRTACPQDLNDSKKLSRATRKELFHHLTSSKVIIWSVGVASVEEIERFNILQATHLAMRRALDGLAMAADFVIVDGRKVPALGKRQLALIGGDGISPSVAGASILAKESRDRLMEEMDTQFPHYGFAQHKGYGTTQHQKALQTHGVCAEHRRSFRPIAELLERPDATLI